MANLELKQVENKEEWEAYMASQPQANFLHSWNWAVFNEKLGKKTYKSGLYDDGRLVGVMITVIEDAKRGKYGAVAAGPITDWSNDEYVTQFVSELISISANEDLVFVRVRPQEKGSAEMQQKMNHHGFKPAQMHLEAELTSQLDITAELDELKKNFRKNTRYELKQAKKKNIQVVESTNPEDIKQFYDLQVTTAQRQGFVPFSYERFYNEFAVFAADNQSKLYSANTDDGQLIAQALIIFYGQEASYHYGASTDIGRDYPGAYALMWQAIQDAKAMGLSRYNFWGVVEPEDTSHRFYGVSVFKRGFRGEDVQYVHAHDLVINKTKYLKNFAVEFARKRTRKV